MDERPRFNANGYLNLSLCETEQSFEFIELHIAASRDPDG